MRYEVRSVRYGEEQPLLDEGWEPFAVCLHGTPYQFLNTATGRMATEHQIAEYIYLRRKVKAISVKTVSDHPIKPE